VGARACAAHARAEILRAYHLDAYAEVLHADADRAGLVAGLSDRELEHCQDAAACGRLALDEVLV